MHMYREPPGRFTTGFRQPTDTLLQFVEDLNLIVSRECAHDCV